MKNTDNYDGTDYLKYKDVGRQGQGDLKVSILRRGPVETMGAMHVLNLNLFPLQK